MPNLVNIRPHNGKFEVYCHVKFGKLQYQFTGTVNRASRGSNVHNSTVYVIETQNLLAVILIFHINRLVLLLLQLLRGSYNNAGRPWQQQQKQQSAAY